MPPTDFRLPLFVFLAGVVAVPFVAEASAAGSAADSAAGAASVDRQHQHDVG
jgi:hypothetical protein